MIVQNDCTNVNDTGTLCVAQPPVSAALNSDTLPLINRLPYIGVVIFTVTAFGLIRLVELAVCVEYRIGQPAFQTSCHSNMSTRQPPEHIV